MDLYELVEEVNNKVDSFVDMMEDVVPEVIGLDRRCARKLHISEDAIIVPKSSDRNLQYYGGFEYVDSQYRTELGDWVIYYAEDERVQDHIQKWLDGKEE